MNNPNFFPKKLIQRTCSVLSKHIQTVKSGVHPIIIRWHFFMIPVMLENQDLRPRLFAKTYVLASPSSLPTHPYKKRLGHYQKKGLLAPYTPGVLTMVRLLRLCCYRSQIDLRLIAQPYRSYNRPSLSNQRSSGWSEPTLTSSTSV